MRDITIQGVVFSAPSPYAVGHVLNENEASVLNQTFSENLRNNFAPKLKAVIDENTKAGVDALTIEQIGTLQTEFAAYAAAYKFGAVGAGGARGPADPIGDLALSKARAKVQAQATAKGLKLTKAKIEEMAKVYFTKHEEKFRAEAAKEIKKAGVESDDMEELFAA
jgi:hypothetical protein